MPPPPRADVPVTTPSALRRRWTDLLEPPVFGARSLWLMWLQADGTALPLMVPIDELPRRPDADTTDRIMDLAGTVHDEGTAGGGHVAAALCRPGHATCTEADQQWAEALGRSATRSGLTDWSLHLAAGGDVLPLVPPPWPAEPDR
jgi:hypothetical protein